MKKATNDESTIYEKVSSERVCCKHGKPCKMSKAARLYILEEILPGLMAPLALSQAEKENTYENLDPNKPKKDAMTAAKKKFFLDKRVVQLANKLPEETKKKEETLETTDSSVSSDSNSKKKKGDKKQRQQMTRAKAIYLGSHEWKKAENLMNPLCPVALYHQIFNDSQKALFMIRKKRDEIKHFRVIQKSCEASETGATFALEDGHACPLEFPTLDKLIEYNEENCVKEN